jgi:hypothetical protein
MQFKKANVLCALKKEDFIPQFTGISITQVPPNGLNLLETLTSLHAYNAPK